MTIFSDPFKGPKERLVPYSFTAHSRWIGAARLPDSQLFATGTFPVLTASDDSLVKLWDLSKVGKSKPRLMWSSNQVHDRGIFAMEVRGNTVVTGSKDKTVALSRIDPAGGALQCSSRYSLHSGVVKGVDLRQDGQVLGSAGQDRCVCVKDTRVKGDSADIEIEECHSGGAHSVQFSPYGDDYLMLTAGLDHDVKLFDLRHSVMPLYTFRGHVPPSIKKIKAITPPIFLSRHTVVTGGQGSHKLSIYCTQTGKTLSRGSMPNDPCNCAVTACAQGLVVAAACRGDIYFLRGEE